MLSKTQQLDLYTTTEHLEWLDTIAEYVENPVVFLNNYRGRWAFSEEELVAFLAEHPERIEQYLVLSKGLESVHDKVLIARDGDGWVVFTTDHGQRRDVERFATLLKAVVRWLDYRYMN